MVYRGEPSKDCLPCRKRKLRCDLRPSGCGQCQRAGLSCFGYRSSQDLIIRDESQNVRRKVLAATGLPDLGPNTSVYIALDVRARHAFFAFYVFGFSRSYDVLASLYEQASPDGHLWASVDAVSLAFLAQQHGSSKLARLANQVYVTAIQRVNQALKDSSLAVTDPVLQSVLLLDLYEKMVTRSPQSIVSWMGHVNGGVALVTLRGRRNLKSYISRRLVTRLRTTLIVSCAAASVRVPRALEELSQELDPKIPKGDVKWAINGLVVAVVNFKADVRDGKFPSVMEVIAVAKRLDQAFAAREEALPLEWRPVRVTIEENNPLVFEGFYHQYQDHVITQVRNVIRINRLMLNDMIQQRIVIDEDASGVASNAKISRAIIESTAREICASVPQFVLPGIRLENQVPFSPLQALRCCTLLGTLYIAGQLSADWHLRCWVVNTLDHIAATGGIQMAKRVADTLKTSPDASYWEVYAMLGSYAFTP
ncbi:hypothetical protein V1525DRAFT_413562 [Lipomyces kononenkoae]|uniref:Uncharacterized protein n=1 Tax=Lipomyces kononenkoae TaxID=34357 RepID=A0ACC3SRL6_LIPKO